MRWLKAKIDLLQGMIRVFEGIVQSRRHEHGVFIIELNRGTRPIVSVRMMLTRMSTLAGVENLLDYQLLEGGVLLDKVKNGSPQFTFVGKTGPDANILPF